MTKQVKTPAGSLLPIAYETILKQLSSNELRILNYIRKDRTLRVGYFNDDLEYDLVETDHLVSLNLIREKVEYVQTETGRPGMEQYPIVNIHKNEHELTALGKEILSISI